MGKIRGLRCETCGAVFPPDGKTQDFCPACGQRFGTLECEMDLKFAAKCLEERPLDQTHENSILRYEPLLPISDRTAFPPLRIGQTPLYQASEIARELGIENLVIKDDGLNPSGSYKDRASAMVVTRGRELGYDVICCASTGNAAASLSACCAASGTHCVVFTPKSAPRAKLAQISAFGARLVIVEGSYDEAFDLATEACRRFGWFNRSAGLNPYLVEGKKTGAYEMCEACNYQVPDCVFVAVGDGSIITGISKGFKEFHALGLITEIPRVYGVQAEGAAVLKEAYDRYYQTGIVDIREKDVETCADSISVGNPREGVRAIHGVHYSHGGFITVTDQQIYDAIRTLAARRGIFSEPAGAVAFAGLLNGIASGIVESTETAGVFITGNGLKDIPAVQKAVNLDLIQIKPQLGELDRLNINFDRE